MILTPPCVSEARDTSDAAEPKNSTLADNDPRKLPPLSKFNGRISVDIGDQTGGPVRYNTEFPDVKDDPHPGSYYHTMAFAGISGEWTFDRGALQLGMLARRDLAHHGIVDREAVGVETTWRVAQFDVRSTAWTVGWLFGRAYREMPWRAALALVVDHAVAHATIETGVQHMTSRSVEMQLWASALRARGTWCLVNTAYLDICAGPEMYVPLYSKSFVRADAELEDWTRDHVDLKSSAALGLVIETGMRL